MSNSLCVCMCVCVYTHTHTHTYIYYIYIYIKLEKAQDHFLLQIVLKNMSEIKAKLNKCVCIIL